MCAHHLSNQLAQELVQQTSLPVVGAPLFLISNPKLVIAQCCAGIIGSFPALNAREEEGDPVMLETWLAEVEGRTSIIGRIQIACCALR